MNIIHKFKQWAQETIEHDRALKFHYVLKEKDVEHRLHKTPVVCSDPYHKHADLDITELIMPPDQENVFVVFATSPLGKYTWIQAQRADNINELVRMPLSLHSMLYAPYSREQVAQQRLHMADLAQMAWIEHGLTS